MTFQNIIFELEEDLAILTLNRPEVSNGFNIPACQEILEAIRLVKDNPSLRFLVIKAKGKVFSVGGDLVEMQMLLKEMMSSLWSRLLSWFRIFPLLLSNCQSLLSSVLMVRWLVRPLILP